MKSGLWNIPAKIQPNNFVNKSLSAFALNLAVGCSHRCGFCYVPAVSTGKGKMKEKLLGLGVGDPGRDWGDYAFPRAWDESAFLASLRKAESAPRDTLPPDGNRAVMLCTTTDAYQIITGEKGKEMNAHLRQMTRDSLRLIRDHSTLNVRILTRSPLAAQDFDLMKSFGNRLTFGMSLPTLDNTWARMFEENAPAPSKRVETLLAAKKAGLHVFVAMAPTYPARDHSDLRATFEQIVKIDPITIFHEPINERADNIARMKANAVARGLDVSGLNLDVFADRTAWAAYAARQLYEVEKLAAEYRVDGRLHLWPDKEVAWMFKREWLNKYWDRVSEWPA